MPNSQPKVLIVEDQLNWRRLYKVWLKNFERITFCTSPKEAIESIQNSPVDLLITDLGLPAPEEGIKMLQDILFLKQNLKIIVVSAYTSRELHLKVQQLGVYAVFRKDERLESELPIFVRKAFEMASLERENHYLRKQFREKVKQYQILGKSDAAERLRQQVQSISQADSPILITGATGAGKNYLAKLIHFHSRRSRRPFVSINCANLPPNLMESELFGHVKGAYTGAESTTIGKFKQADGGTVLLDEIGEIPVKLQAKLLQVIEDKSFYPLGGRKEIYADVRILASTNRDLTHEIRKGTFREDLYYRIAGFVLPVPSLSERKKDIPDYFDYLLKETCEEEGIAVPEIAPEVYSVIQNLPWTGNLRELKNAVIRLLLFHPERITIQNLTEQGITIAHHPPAIEKALQREYSLKEISAIYARALYNKLHRKTEVAEILNIDRKTLNRYLKMKVD
ncbi:MAG: sigma-54 dependent transcriptional regulator [Calditrichia bacterium]